MEFHYKKKIDFTATPIRKAMIIPVFQDMPSLKSIIGKQLDNKIRKFLLSDFFTDDNKSIKNFLYEASSSSTQQVYLINTPSEKANIKTYMKMGRSMALRLQKDKVLDFSIIAFENVYKERKNCHITKAFLEGMMFTDYAFENFKSKKTFSPFQNIDIISPLLKVEEYITKNSTALKTIFENINIVKDLVNTPANLLTPNDFATYVGDNINKNKNLSIEILDQKAIIKNKLNLLNAVGGSSKNSPYFIKLKYTGNKDSDKHIALVGKGITFDSGGYSLKPAESMTTMKSDMTGAATVFALIKLLSELKIKANVYGYIPLAENMVGQNAIVPGDVIVSHSGKTVEILNTDAEGRLILADAISVAKEEEPEIIIDIATLTGACIVALGPFCAGYFTNEKGLSEKIKNASTLTAEDIWELPLYSGYASGLKSSVADINNLSSYKREGGAIHAALFLKEFVGKLPWIHLDIAGPAYLEREHPYFGREATGFGVRLLYEFIRYYYAKNKNDKEFKK